MKAPSTQPALVAETIEQLRNLDPEGGFFVRLVEAYLEKSPSDLGQIREGITNADAETVRAAAHGFKSSSANLGAMSLYALCQKLESAAASGDLSKAGPLFEGIETEYDRVRSALTEISGVTCTNEHIEA